MSLLAYATSNRNLLASDDEERDGLWAGWHVARVIEARLQSISTLLIVPVVDWAQGDHAEFAAFFCGGKRIFVAVVAYSASCILAYLTGRLEWHEPSTIMRHSRLPPE